MDQAFRYWIAKGATTESTYPYTAVDGKCHYDASTSQTTVSSYTDVQQDEGALKTAVARNPVSIAIYALSIMQYTGGIYSDYSACPSGLLDHCVLAVGYGTSSSQDFWKVKNSWGLHGEKMFSSDSLESHQDQESVDLLPLLLSQFSKWVIHTHNI